MIFERLWRETGCQAVIETLLADRKFEFPVERAIFAGVLHRLCLSGSDRSCDRWLEGYRLTGLDGVDISPKRSRFRNGTRSVDPYALESVGNLK